MSQVALPVRYISAIVIPYDPQLHCFDPIELCIVFAVKMTDHLFIHCCLLVVISLLPVVLSVRGCVTYVTGEDYSMRQSICDKPDTHFTSIPITLPSQVVKLTVNHQDITELNATQLKHLPNLTYLDLDSNKIARIHPNTFHLLKYLRTLSLRFNLLTFTADSFHPDVPRGLIGLEVLNLLQNPMGYVPRRLFAPIGSSLRSLVLSGGSEQFQLDPHALEGLTMLHLLDLSYNHLETLPESLENTLQHMQLKEFYLYGNPWRCDCNLRWLKVWFLKYNSKLIYSRPVPEGVNRNSLDPSAQRWYDLSYDGGGDGPALLQPRCASPYALFGRPIFSHQTLAGLQPVRTTDFHCVPQAMTPNQPVQFTQGSNASLKCEFFADPTGIVVWYRNGTLIQQRWTRVSMQQTTGRNFHAELHVQDVQPTDAGTYVCFLDTGHGRVNTTFSVQVIPEEQSMASRITGGVFQWINRLNTTLVLKYTGIIASCLIMLLMIIGLFIYCFYGKRNRLSKTPFDCDHVNSAADPETDLHSCSPMKVGTKTGTYDYLSPTSSAAPQSSLIRKDHLPTELKDNMREMQLVSTSTEKVDNYVTFRYWPTDAKNEQSQRCSMHNYAIIHPVSAEPVLLDNSEPRLISIRPSAQLLVSPSSLSAAPLEQTEQSQLIVLKDPERLIPSTNISGMIQPSTQLLAESGISIAPASKVTDPSTCPLHGHIYATLHSQHKDRKDKLDDAKLHIATMPIGLGSAHEKRINTLPSRKRSPGLGTVNELTTSGFVTRSEFASDTANKSIGSSMSTTPDITTANGKPNEPRFNSNENTVFSTVVTS